MNETDAEDTVEVLRERYESAREEFRYYRDELMGMVEEGEKESDLWEEYRREMKKAGQRSMKLKRELNAAENAEKYSEPLYYLRRAISKADGPEREILIKAHNEILSEREERIVESVDGE